MAEDLSSIMGGGPTPADVPGKKKLKKVGDHYEDEQGNKFSDEAGTQPIKSEGEQAKAGAPAVNAQSPSSFMDQIRENPGQNVGNVMTGEVSKKPSSIMGGSIPDTGGYDEDSHKVYQAFKSDWNESEDSFRARWKGFSQKYKKMLLDSVGV